MQHLDEELRQARANKIDVSDDTLTAHLEDGRSISCPLLWYPDLSRASTDERQNYRLIGRGTGIHWPDLDADVSIRGMLLGRKGPRPAQQNADTPTDERQVAKKSDR